MIRKHFLSRLEVQVNMIFKEEGIDPEPLDVHISHDRQRDVITVKYQYLDVCSGTHTYPASNPSVGYRQHQLDLLEEISDDLYDAVSVKLSEGS